MVIACLAGCGCAGGQPADTCNFAPSCPRCGRSPMNPDPIAPARGIAWGLVIGALCWVAIFAAAAVVWLNVIAPEVLP